ncbi:TPA: hypothetical protein EYP83_00500, partial [Candidatus Geothermarchaeota archaeon]|nr:hypothetical protein [Candidatus Geothermarchaeota archaeon]
MSNEPRFTLTNDELTLMSVFSGLTGVNPITCKIVDDIVYFLISDEDIYTILSDPIMRREIRKNISGRLTNEKVLKELSRIISENLNKSAYVVAYYPDPIRFLRGFFGLNSDARILMSESAGRKVVTIQVPPNRKGALIGRGGVRARA